MAILKLINLIDLDKIVISDKFEHGDKGFKYFIAYKEDNIIRPLCIILRQMNGCIKYFDNGGKICLLKSKINVLVKHNKT